MIDPFLFSSHMVSDNLTLTLYSAIIMFYYIV